MRVGPSTTLRRWPPPTLRYLTRADVEAVGLGGIEVLGVLERRLPREARGAVEMPAKIGVHPRDDAFIHAMPAYLESADAVGIKWVAGYPGNQDAGLPYIHGLFVLTDAGTGAPLASWTRPGSPRSAPRPPACSASARSPSGRSRRSG